MGDMAVHVEGEGVDAGDEAAHVVGHEMGT